MSAQIYLRVSLSVENVIYSSTDSVVPGSDTDVQADLELLFSYMPVAGKML